MDMGIKMTVKQATFFRGFLELEQLENYMLSEEQCRTIMGNRKANLYNLLKPDKSGKLYCSRQELISYLLNENPKEIHKIEDLKKRSSHLGLTFADLK